MTTYNKAPHIDKFLTNFSLKYTNENMVADIIAPVVKVQKSSDKYLIYKKDNLRIYDNIYRSGSESNGIEHFTEDATYAAEEYALHDVVLDREKANADTPANPRIDTTEFITEAMVLARENRVVSIVTDTNVVTNNATPANKWDAASSTPKADIFTGIKTVQASVLRPPNSIFIPFETALVLARHSDYTDDSKYTKNLSGMFGLPDVLWGLKVYIVTTAYVGDQTGASDPSISALWSDSVLIAYVNPAPAGLKTMHFMKSFTPVARYIWSEYVRKLHGEWIESNEEMDEVVTAAGCAYLLTDCLT